jgi:phosphoglycolate phosphatase
MPIRHVIWDWNGTLLDDVDACVDTLNSLLAERAMPTVDREAYRDRFGFPVRAYYEGLGFDFEREDFGALSRDFIARFRARVSQLRLTPGARALLADLRAGGVRHLVVSAMETGLLGTMLAEYALAPLVDGHHGRADLHAGPKVELGLAAVRARGLRADEILVVGDTLHDHELAEAIGCRSVLFSGGHQTRARLASAGTTVVDSLDEVAPILARA